MITRISTAFNCTSNTSAGYHNVSQIFFGLSVWGVVVWSCYAGFMIFSQFKGTTELGGLCGVLAMLGGASFFIN